MHHQKSHAQHVKMSYSRCRWSVRTPKTSKRKHTYDLRAQSVLGTCIWCAKGMYMACRGLISNVHTPQNPKICYSYIVQPKHGVKMVHFEPCTGRARSMHNFSLHFMSLTLKDTVFKLENLICLYLTFFSFLFFASQNCMQDPKTQHLTIIASLAPYNAFLYTTFP